MTEPESKAKLALDAAWQRDPGNEWVERMREFYNKYGRLSEKQIETLERVQPSMSWLHGGAKKAFKKGKLTREEYGLLLTTESVQEYDEIYEQILTKRKANQVIPYLFVNKDNIHQHFPQSSYMGELLKKTSPYGGLDNRRNPERTIGILKDIANGLIRPTMLDLCEFEEWESREHEQEQDWLEVNSPHHEREPYESFLDREFYG